MKARRNGSSTGVAILAAAVLQVSLCHAGDLTSAAKGRSAMPAPVLPVRGDSEHREAARGPAQRAPAPAPAAPTREVAPSDSVAPIPTPAPTAARPGAPPQAPYSKWSGSIKIEGTYASENDPQAIKVRHIMGDFYDISSSSWEGIGILDGSTYHGVFRQKGDPATRGLGDLRIEWTDLQNPMVHATYREPKEQQVDSRWKRLGDLSWSAGSPSLLANPSPSPTSLPAFGDYVFVEQLPEVITRAQPTYPDLARENGVQGTVMVQALVTQYGNVADTRITGSIPGLDEVAAAAVRQWRFKPAMAKGVPVAVWVAVPVKFSLH